MLSHRSTMTLQANRAEQGDFSSSDSTFQGLGLGIYVGAVGNVQIVTLGGDTAVYTAVPAGTFMQVPNFVKVTAAGTTSTDLNISYFDYTKKH